jgi:TRAP-type mannitol/chloroaromatic compound transport system permease small subunit
VDILYSSLSKKRKAYVNLAGTLIILFPVLLMVGFYALPYINASWQILEGSTESSGLHLVFLLKSLILLFVVSTFLQGISVSFHSIIVIAGSGDLVEGSLGEKSQ